MASGREVGDPPCCRHRKLRVLVREGRDFPDADEGKDLTDAYVKAMPLFLLHGLRCGLHVLERRGRLQVGCGVFFGTLLQPGLF